MTQWPAQLLLQRLLATLLALLGGDAGDAGDRRLHLQAGGLLVWDGEALCERRAGETLDPLREQSSYALRATELRLRGALILLSAGSEFRFGPKGLTLLNGRFRLHSDGPALRIGVQRIGLRTDEAAAEIACALRGTLRLWNRPGLCTAAVMTGFARLGPRIARAKSRFRFVLSAPEPLCVPWPRAAWLSEGALDQEVSAAGPLEMSSWIARLCRSSRFAAGGAEAGFPRPEGPALSAGLAAGLWQRIAETVEDSTIENPPLKAVAALLAHELGIRPFLAGEPVVRGTEFAVEQAWALGIAQAFRDRGELPVFCEQEWPATDAWPTPSPPRAAQQMWRRTLRELEEALDAADCRVARAILSGSSLASLDPGGGWPLGFGPRALAGLRRRSLSETSADPTAEALLRRWLGLSESATRAELRVAALALEGTFIPLASDWLLP